jgi:hypothetical protein
MYCSGDDLLASCGAREGVWGGGMCFDIQSFVTSLKLAEPFWLSQVVLKIKFG